MGVLFVRELVLRLNSTKLVTSPVVIDLANPGLCKSEISCNSPKASLVARNIRSITEHETEVGSRTFVLAASAAPSSHGEYMTDGKNQDVESWILTDMGKRAQKRFLSRL